MIILSLKYKLNIKITALGSRSCYNTLNIDKNN